MKKITTLIAAIGLMLGSIAQEGTWSYTYSDINSDDPYGYDYESGPFQSAHYNNQKKCAYVSYENFGIYRVDSNGGTQITNRNSDIVQSSLTGDTLYISDGGIVSIDLEGNLIDSIYINDLKSFIRSGDRFFTISTYENETSGIRDHLLISEYSIDFNLISSDSTNIYNDYYTEIEMHADDSESFRFALKHWNKYNLYECNKTDSLEIDQLLEYRYSEYRPDEVSKKSIYGDKIIIRKENQYYADGNYGVLLVYDANMMIDSIEFYDSYSIGYSADENYIYIGKYIYDNETLSIVDSIDGNGLQRSGEYAYNRVDENQFFFFSSGTVSLLNENFEHKCKYHYLSDNNVEITVEENHPKLIWEADDKNRDISVYRLTGFYDEFTLVGQSNSSSNGFIDTTVDARTQNYFYSYSSMNVCRDSTPPIPDWFKFGTIHLSAFEGLNGKNELIWNSYFNEEGKYDLVSRYHIYHSEDGENYSLIDSTTGSVIEDYEVFINLKYTHVNPSQSNNYMIEAVYPSNDGNRSSEVSILSNVGDVTNDFVSNIEDLNSDNNSNIIIKDKNVLIEGFEGESMILYNISGQLIQQEFITSNNYQIELSNIEPGIYFVKASDRVKKVYLR